VKFIVRWLFRLLLLGLVLFLGTLLLKDTLLKEWAEARLRRRTGLEVQIGRLEVNLLSPTITVEDLKIFNPPEFGGAPFVDIPDGHLEYDKGALGLGGLHLRLVRLRIAELSVVRNRQGASNLQAIQQLLRARAAPQGSAWTFEGIDTLNLSFDQIRAYELGSPTPARVYNLGLRNEILTNLRTAQELERALQALLARWGLGSFLAPASPATNTAGARLPPG
jgi:hypothetical protein